jgi:cytochrome P450 family 114
VPGDQVAVATVDGLAKFADPEIRRNPYPFLRWLRENDPVHRTAAGFYMVSRHADAARVMQDSATFMSPDQMQLMEQFPSALKHLTMSVLVRSLPSLNAPEHTRLRRLVARDFTPRRVEELRPVLAGICDRILDRLEPRLRDGETVDLHSEWSKPFTVDVMSELIGVPPEERAWMGTAAGDIAAGVTSHATNGPVELRDLADEQTARLSEYFARLGAERRRSPRNDLISALVSTREDDSDRLDPDELFTILWVLWIAGFENSAMGLDSAVWTMFGHPEQSSWLRRDFAAALAFVDEALRFTGPAMFAPTARIAVRDVELSGVPLPAGSDLRPVFAAANRDPDVFADPDRFDPSRDASKALALGGGMHYCLGAFLAKAEIATGLMRIHSRFPTLINVSEPAWGTIVMEPSARAVPVALAF